MTNATVGGGPPTAPIHGTTKSILGRVSPNRAPPSWHWSDRGAEKGMGVSTGDTISESKQGELNCPRFTQLNRPSQLLVPVLPSREGHEKRKPTHFYPPWPEHLLVVREERGVFYNKPGGEAKRDQHRWTSWAPSGVSPPLACLTG